MGTALDIAIVGFGGVFPGATDLAAFWENVRSGADAAVEVPSERWLLDPQDVYTDEVAAADKVYSRRACLVGDVSFDDEDLDLEPALRHARHGRPVPASERMPAGRSAAETARTRRPGTCELPRTLPAT